MGNTSPTVPQPAGIPEGTHQSHHLLCGAKAELLWGGYSLYASAKPLWTKPVQYNSTSQISSLTSIESIWANTTTDPLSHTHIKSTSNTQQLHQLQSVKERQTAGIWSTSRPCSVSEAVHHQELTSSAVASTWHHWRTTRAIVQKAPTRNPIGTDRTMLMHSSQRAGTHSIPLPGGHPSCHLPAPRADNYPSLQPDTICGSSPEAEWMHCCY